MNVDRQPAELPSERWRRLGADHALLNELAAAEARLAAAEELAMAAEIFLRANKPMLTTAPWTATLEQMLAAFRASKEQAT